MPAASPGTLSGAFRPAAAVPVSRSGEQEAIVARPMTRPASTPAARCGTAPQCRTGETDGQTIVAAIPGAAAASR